MTAALWEADIMGIPVVQGRQNELWELAQLGFCWHPSVSTDDCSLQIQFDGDIIIGDRKRLGVKRVVLDADTISPELIGVDKCMV